MESIEAITKNVLTSLQALCSQVQTQVPTAICNTGTINRDEEKRPYASFLKTPQSDTTDLCAYINLSGGILRVSADLVKGGSGEVISEMESITSLPKESEFGRLLDAVNEYIFFQKERIIKELKDK